MQKETARDFWQRYLRLACKGTTNVNVSNPAVAFAVSAKAGEYDGMPEDQYKALLNDHEQLSSIWHDTQYATVSDILLTALSMTNISDTCRDAIVDLLAECSVHSEYLPPSDPGECEVSLHCKDPWGVFDTPIAAWSSLTPRKIYDYLSWRIRGQHAAKKAAATVLYNHVNGCRSNALFCGPSGCGKSEIWRHLAKQFPRLIRIVDASRLSAEGWAGSLHLRDVFENVRNGLSTAGLIVVFDEADKVCCETAISSSGTNHNALVQNNLLKMLDGDVIEFGNEKDREPFSVDCSRVSVVMLGAFEYLMQNKSRASGGGIGFGSPIRRECNYSNTEITYDDLIAAGMRREIAGRINRIAPLSPLSVEDYRTILMGPVLDDLQADRRCGITIDGQYADSLVEQAATTGLGVRWMKSQVINALDDLMFDDPAAGKYIIGNNTHTSCGIGLSA